MPLPSAQAQPPQWRAVREIVLARDSRICRACGDTCSQGEADVHHLIPRAAGGVDDPANLITLCDGCHAAHHPNLQGTLARRTIERWGLRLARWLDRRHELADVDESLGAAMRLLGVTRLRTPQLEVILAALRGESLLLVSATGSGKVALLSSAGPFEARLRARDLAAEGAHEPAGGRPSNEEGPGRALGNAPILAFTAPAGHRATADHPRSPGRRTGCLESGGRRPERW